MFTPRTTLNGETRYDLSARLDGRTDFCGRDWNVTASEVTGTNLFEIA
jgi:hypothetical protein